MMTRPPVPSARANPLILPPLDRHSQGAKSFVSGDILYQGGPVISHVKVAVVFWGARVDSQTVAKIPAFYEAIVKSTYLDQLAEYGTKRVAVNGKPGTQQEIGRGSVIGTYTIVPINASSALNQTSIEKELEQQVAMGALPKPDADTMYMIYYPAGISISISFGKSCATWGADHEYYHSPNFGNMYYAMMPNCGYSFAKTTEASSHELAEAITDPASPLEGAPVIAPAAWIRGDGQEIGDVCAWQEAKLKAGSAVYVVQKEWRNSRHDCGAAVFEARSSFR